ncbi:MAG: hypothetical protein KA004_05780 [Verrucomicrobiales bacterium]|nr:hypothetical protein [Verrucomicrobiales bacterium]
MTALDTPLTLHPAGLRTGTEAETVGKQEVSMPLPTRQWTWLAVSSLVVAGLLSLSVVIGRIPVVSRWIGDPLFFKRCLVVHVDLALIAWFYTFIAGISAMRTPGETRGLARWALPVSAVGLVLMLAGAAVPGAMPVLSNYIPVIDHPLFYTGLGVFFVGVLLSCVRQVLAPPAPLAGGLPADASTGLLAAALAVVLAAATWVSARSGLPQGLDAWTRAEFSTWGAGHVLQVANVSAMLAVWLWLLRRATGLQVLSGCQARVLFTLLLAPHFLMPLLTWRGTMNPLYIDGATALMRWGIFPVVLAVLYFSIRHLRRNREWVSESVQRVAVAGFKASAALTVLGIGLGACIRSSNTLIPAHYHASLGAVTAAFMAGAYLIIERFAHEAGRTESLAKLWRSARRQLVLFGIGQSVFAVGFGIGGAYGLGRKTYAGEQHVRSFGELAGIGIMGLGGLLAVAAGLWFLTLVIRELRRGRPAEKATPRLIPTRLIP